MKSKILFNSKSHTYTSGKKIQYGSVSSLIGKYKQPYNSDYWSMYKAYERILGNQFKSLKKGYKLQDPLLFDYLIEFTDAKELLKIQKEILKEWGDERDKSIIKGNNYHTFKESQAILSGVCLNPFSNTHFKTVESTKITIKNKIEYREPIVSDLIELEDGFHPELILWNNDHKIAGQADKVYIETDISGRRFVDVDDYKGLALDTPIFTTNGWKVINDIIVGDNILDGTGKLTTVQHVSNIHYNPCYKITFDTNDTIIADHEHKWVLSERIDANKYKNKEYTTEDIFLKFDNLKLKKLPRVACTNIDIKTNTLPIDPYILGLWLADGNRTCSTLTCENPEIWKKIINKGYKISNNHNQNYNRADSRTIYNIRKHLISLNLLNNKHIPFLYINSSFDQRLELLQGIMDGDGYYNNSRKRCVMTTTKEWQATQVSSLISSLGFKPTIIKATGTGFRKTFNKFDVCFTPNINPFLVRNQNIDFTNNKKYSNFRIITKIEKVDTIATKCLAVDSNDHTYLFGYNFIKTHNTNKVIKKTNFFGNMLSPLSHLACCNYNHYRLQISTYAWMLEQAGYTVRNTAFTHLNQQYDFEYMKPEVKLMLNIE